MRKMKEMFSKMNKFFNSMADNRFEIKQESFNNFDFHKNTRSFH